MPALKLNDDLDQARQRWSQWFDGTLTDGPIVSVTAPLESPRRPLLPTRQPRNDREKWMDLDSRAAAARNQVMSTWYGGDAVPMWWVNFGPGAVAGYLGSPLTFTDRTVWFNELPDNSLAGIAASLRYDAENEYWQAARELTAKALDLADGEFLVSITDLGGELDILASLRGTQKLLMDLLEDPQGVKDCEDRICRLWLRYFHELEAMLTARQEGFGCWMTAYNSRPWYALQCDISAMFSPDLFAQFVVPRLNEKLQEMDAAIYHWDGPGELVHLDHLLTVEKVRALEYVSVPGDPRNSSLHWLPYYRRIAEAGKGVYIRVSDVDEIIELSRRMPAERLAFQITRPSVADAKRFLSAFGR